MDAPREPTPPCRPDAPERAADYGEDRGAGSAPTPAATNPSRRFATPPSTAAATGRGPTATRRGMPSGHDQTGPTQPSARIKDRTVGHGGRTTTYRVWPLWFRVVRVLLGLGLVAGAVGVARGIDLADLRSPPFDLDVPGLSGDRGENLDETEGRRSGWTARPATVPVLMYRQLGDASEGSSTQREVIPERLGEQLAHLAEQGYTSVTVSEYLAALDGAALPERPVLLTFDGTATELGAYLPILQEHRMVATFFIVASGSPAEEDAVRALLAAGELGGHAATPPLLSELSAVKQRAAIVENREWLEGIAGTAPVAFAYPAGGYNDETVPALEAAGYAIAFDAWGGLAPVTDRAANRWHLSRIAVEPDDSVESFAAKVVGG